MTIKLYASTNVSSPNSLKLRVALHEAGAAFEYIPVDLSQGQHRAPEFLAMNPHAKIPVLVDDGFALPESGAILWYIAEKFPAAKLVPASPHGRARTHEWCDFASTGTYAALLDFNYHTVFLPPEKRSASVVELAEGRMMRGLDVLEQVLGGREYLAGEYSIADIANAVVVQGARVRMPELAAPGKRPRLDAWFERVSSRPAWRAATQA